MRVGRGFGRWFIVADRSSLPVSKGREGNQRVEVRKGWRSVNVSFGSTLTRLEQCTTRSVRSKLRMLNCDINPEYQLCDHSVDEPLTGNLPKRENSRGTTTSLGYSSAIPRHLKVD